MLYKEILRKNFKYKYYRKELIINKLKKEIKESL
jgi:hypothetical protein